jgi:hypothetical protein
MSANSRQKDRESAAHLKARGIYHGKRMSKGLDNIPNLSDVGSAAYRRLKGYTKKGQ